MLRLRASFLLLLFGHRSKSSQVLVNVSFHVWFPSITLTLHIEGSRANPGV